VDKVIAILLNIIMMFLTPMMNAILNYVIYNRVIYYRLTESDFLCNVILYRWRPWRHFTPARRSLFHMQ